MISILSISKKKYPYVVWFRSVSHEIYRIYQLKWYIWERYCMYMGGSRVCFWDDESSIFLQIFETFLLLMEKWKISNDFVKLYGYYIVFTSFSSENCCLRRLYAHTSVLNVSEQHFSRRYSTVKSLLQTVNCFFYQSRGKTTQKSA